MGQDKTKHEKGSDEYPSGSPALHKTPEYLEHLARTSTWGDEGLAPIQPWWRREKRVPIPLDGTMLWQVTPLTDAQLIWLARCLQPDEKARLDQFWKEIVEDPLGPAIEAMKEIYDRPKRLLNRRGRHTGPLGENALELELSRLLIHRLWTVALEAVSSVPEPKRTHTVRVAARILMELVHPCLVVEGDLKDHHYNFLPIVAAQLRRNLPPAQREAFDKSPVETFAGLIGKAVEAALDRELRKDRSRAFWITLELWNEIGEPVEERSLRRILARPAHLRPVPDLIGRHPA